MVVRPAPGQIPGQPSYHGRTDASGIQKVCPSLDADDDERRRLQNGGNKGKNGNKGNGKKKDGKKNKAAIESAYRLVSSLYSLGEKSVGHLHLPQGVVNDIMGATRLGRSTMNIWRGAAVTAWI